MVSSPTLVCLWDLDETLIIYDSLRKGTYPTIDAVADPDLCLRLGAKLSSLLMSLLDGVFGFRQLEAVDIGRCPPSFPTSSRANGAADVAPVALGDHPPPKRPLTAPVSATGEEGHSKRPRAASVNATGEEGNSKRPLTAPVSATGEEGHSSITEPLSPAAAAAAAAAPTTAMLASERARDSDSARVAGLVARASARYSGGEATLAALVPAPWLAARARTLAAVDALTGSWRLAAAGALAEVAALGGVNVVVTASHGVAALAKLLLFLGAAGPALVEPCRVYSAAHRPKLAAFQQALTDLAGELASERASERAGERASETAAAAPGAGCASDDGVLAPPRAPPPRSGTAAAINPNGAPGCSSPRPLPTVCAGDGDEEARAAGALGLPFVRVRRVADLAGVAEACRMALAAGNPGSEAAVTAGSKSVGAGAASEC